MDKGNKPNHLLWILGGAAVAAFLIVLGLYIAYFKNLSVTNDSATWGTFGDYLGGTLNPIISFLALIGLLYTIHQQAQEMQATREELKQAANQRFLICNSFNRHFFLCWNSTIRLLKRLKQNQYLKNYMIFTIRKLIKLPHANHQKN